MAELVLPTRGYVVFVVDNGPPLTVEYRDGDFVPFKAPCVVVGLDHAFGPADFARELNTVPVSSSGARAAIEQLIEDLREAQRRADLLDNVALMVEEIDRVFWDDSAFRTEPSVDRGVRPAVNRHRICMGRPPRRGGR